MTTADMSLVAKESIVVEKLKNYMPAQFFCPTLYYYSSSVQYLTTTEEKHIGYYISRNVVMLIITQ